MEKQKDILTPNFKKMKIRLKREAAVNLRKIWQAHDERNEAEGWLAASELYKILGANSEQA